MAPQVIVVGGGCKSPHPYNVACLSWTDDEDSIRPECSTYHLPSRGQCHPS